MQFNKRPKPQNKCTGGGDHGGGSGDKNTDVQLSSETSSIHLVSLWQATCHSADPSPITSVLRPQSRATAVPFEPGVLRVECGESVNATLECCGPEQRTQQTYANCLTVKFMLQKKLALRFIFVTFFLSTEKTTNTLLGERRGIEKTGPG